MDQINWSNHPPRVPQARVWVPPVGKHWVCLLGSCKGVWVHWMGKRSLPCLGGNCPAARHKRPIYWVGYYPALLQARYGEQSKPGSETQIVLPVSADLYYEHDDSPHGEVRGTCLLIAKEGGQRAWKVTKHQAHAKAQALPPAFEVSAVLYRLWGILPPTFDPAPWSPPETPGAALVEVGQADEIE